MSAVVIGLIIVLTVWWASQALLVLGFLNRLKQANEKLIEDDRAPQAIVILCLRGGDPFLSRCVDGLISQDYPNYTIRFMVDHEEDPSLPILKAALANRNFANYQIATLKNPLSTCSLKCSALVQALTDCRSTATALNTADLNPPALSAQTLPVTAAAPEFIALLDADTVPHATWLRELATALDSPQVGAATGNRWYMPDRPSVGSLTRYAWNAAAVVQMFWYEIAWGGTLAIKIASIDQADLLSRWRSALCEDTMLRRQLASINQKVKFVPSLMMVNREDCTLSGLVPWIRRQLLTARLYHPMWLAVVGHGLLSALVQLLGWGLAIGLLLTGNWAYGLMLLTIMCLFQFALWLLLPWMERHVRCIVQSRSEATNDWQQQVSILQSIKNVFVTQWVYTWALLSCLMVRRIEWRGIEYEALGPWKIRMLEYQPYRSAQSESLNSL